MTIHQIIATSCTQGTSARMRDRGPSARDSLGLGPRSASVKGQRLEELYRLTIPYSTFKPPLDVEVSQYASYSTHEAPRRLIFDRRDGKTIIGNISFRQTDVSGRPGTYFAHFLIDESSEMRPIDAISLCDAPGWKIEDADLAELPHDLTTLDSHGDLLQQQKWLTDELLIAFVGGEQDGMNRLPERWQTIPLEKRARMLQEAIQLVMEYPDTNRRIGLVAEWQTAALLLYGVFRLLPDDITRDLSFSTYEQSLKRCSFTIAATSLDRPNGDEIARRDMPADRVLLAIDAPPNELTHEYADRIVSIVKNGPDSIENLLSALKQYGCSTIASLDGYTLAKTAVDSVLQGNTPSNWGDIRVLKNEINRELANGLLPDVSLEPIVTSKQLDIRWKQEVLLKYLQANDFRIPTGYESLFQREEVSTLR